MDIFENFVDVTNKVNEVNDDKQIESANPDECFTLDVNLDGANNYSCIQCGKIFDAEKKVKQHFRHLRKQNSTGN